MKILLIYNEYIYGGGEDTNFHTLAQLLKKHGHEVFKFTKSSKEIKESLKDQIQIGLEMVYNPSLIKELENIINTFKPEIVHLQNIYPLMNDSIYKLLKEKNVQVVQSIYNYRYICPKMSLFRDGNVCTDCVRKFFPYPSIIHSCYHGSAGASFAFSLSHSLYKMTGMYKDISVFLFPSKFIKDFYTKNTSIDSKKTALIPNCYLPTTIKSHIPVPSNRYTLFYGRLTEEKGIPLLLKAMSQTPKIPLVIIGDGPLKKQVQHYAKKYKNIIYKGVLKREDTLEFVKKAQFIIMPSAWYDVLPNVLLESYAHKKPVIAPKFGVFADIVKDHDTGYHYQYNNEVDLKEKIETLYNDLKQIVTLGKNAFEEFQKQYTSELYYSRIIKLYSKLLKKNNHV